MLKLLRKVLSFGLLAFALSAHAAHALTPSTYQQPPTRPQSHQPDENSLLEHQHYQNSDGNSIHSPRTPAAAKPRPARQPSAETGHSASASTTEALVPGMGAW
nr:DUF3761 domain-containing protein [Acetobacter persici]